MISIIKKNASSFNKKAQSWDDAMKLNVGHKYLEKPAMCAELPKSLRGKTVLSIGIGSGDEIEIILEKNPDKIVGIDISKELLKIVSRKYPTVKLKKMDMMNMSFKDEVFDYIYSSLTFHYANDWDILLKGVARVLRVGGTLLFSTHNPLHWSNKPETGSVYTNKRGVILKEHTDLLPGNVKIIYYNHPNKESIRKSVEYAGFQIKSFFTPLVINFDKNGEEFEKYKKLKKKNAETPLFLVVRAVKL